MDNDAFAEWLRSEISHAEKSLKEIELFEGKTSGISELTSMLINSKSHYQSVIKTNGDILSRIEISQ